MSYKYYCAWVSEITGAKGHGTALFDFDEAFQYCITMNEQKEDKKLKIYHYVLREDEVEKEITNEQIS